MTNLTEQWKKGELPAGRYYIRLTPDYEKPLETNDYFLGVDFELTDNDSVDEVLAPVPSFEQWQELKEYERIVTSYNMKPIDYDIACETVNKLLDEKKVLKEENTKLKELLKECREHFITYKRDDLDKGYVVYDGSYLIDKINQVLGEE